MEGGEGGGRPAEGGAEDHRADLPGWLTLKDVWVCVWWREQPSSTCVVVCTCTTYVHMVVGHTVCTTRCMYVRVFASSGCVLGLVYIQTFGEGCGLA